MNTIHYYNKYSSEFIESTFDVDMESLYLPFLKNIPEGGLVLDLGCGSGRDTLAFKNKGYKVEAMDYSEALVEQATTLTGIQIRHESFYELTDSNQYDGIWACASLLHCDRNRLPDVLKRIYNALRRGGICYMSFKYGSTDREKDGRAFTDLDEVQAKELLDQLQGVEVLQQWITVDKRPDRNEEWLNILWKK
ncbi:methyltransferase domain-containing protein [Acinetobacter sp. R933-2]|uniref:class I SAM-dependent methyltransferase n=1 Tax=Acinetobacter sp. R933-2 TaxID=2746728 RepID=UPI00257750C0|nr:class I SAM-dependent methyltransferase [Acinetobacter sp. R933-2]MDM1248955.1 methyltransferase domain-containing protein [Acinetobacter sp. R933-2]